MRRVLFSIAFFIAGFFFAQNIAYADTGTYKILDYTVKLTPKSDGTVEIGYYQKWSVTSGHIPWITVGTANGNFQIIGGKNKGAVTLIRSDNYNNWYGVRIDLNKDYKAGETFEIAFTIIQNQLFYADEENYRLDFTPGWYDRAQTEHLRVEVFAFAKLDTIKASPEPTRTEGQSIIWEKYNLNQGGKFRITVSFLRVLFPKAIPQQVLSRKSHGKLALLPVLIIVSSAIVIIMRIVFGIRRSLRYGRGGTISHGGLRTGVSRGAGGTGEILSGIFSGGGGGFGGRSFSCACACAGCACACACAGGGAAGCQRKISHRCPLCKSCQNIDNCPIWKESV
ncbi:MAG: hypothetical protein NTX52_04385 [Planctomycetota bacterium]|nr:hypothetical protein [Planctomycetota bacterium]